MSTTGGCDIVHNKHLGQVSTIMRALTYKDGDFLSHFDKVDENAAQINNTFLKHHLINNHDEAANKSRIKGQLLFEKIFGFCRTFKKVTKQIGFHLTSKTTDLQDINHTTVGDDIKINFDKLILYVPIFIPDANNQIMFQDSIEK